jgi:uncharacterized protein (TIGR03083 family)
MMTAETTTRRPTVLDFEAARAATIDEIRRLTERASLIDPDEWARPTRLPGWTVSKLIAHVISSQECQGEAVRRLLAGSTETPPIPDIAVTEPATLAKRLAEEGERVIDALEAMEPSHLDQMVPLPFATVPAAIGIYVMLIEYAWHRNDLAHALDGDTRLDAEIASTALNLIPGFMPQAATEVPDPPFAYEIASTTAPCSFVPADGAWTAGPTGDLPTCRFAGDDSTLALFALGRLGADHPWIEVSGAAADRAAEFKTWFPGP